MTLKAKVISGLKWTAGAKLGGQIVTWAITIVVMRLLAPADYGLLAIASVFIGLFAIIAEIGLSSALVQSKEVDELLLRKVLGAVLLVHFGLFLIVALLIAPFSATWFNEPRLTLVLQVLSTQFLVTAFAVIPGSLLDRSMNFRGRSLIELAAALAGGLVTLALAYSGNGVWSLVVGNLAGALIRTIGINLQAPFLRIPVFSLRGLGYLLSFGRDVVLSRLLWFLYSQSDVFIAGKMLGKEQLGFYSVAMHLASLPVQRISSIINQIAFPAFSRMQGEEQRVASSFLLGIRLQTFFAVPILWGISSVAPELVRVFLGSQWESSILPLQILTLMMPFRMASNFTPAVLQGIGRADLGLRNLVVLSVVMPPAFFLGATFGVIGISLAWVMAYPIVFLINLTFTLPALHVPFGRFIRDLLLPIIPGSIMFGAVFFTRELLLEASNSTRLICLILVGIFAYLAGVLTVSRHGLREVIDLLGAGGRQPGLGLPK
jgi:O-antigen/teichoic acid export membrane protein